MPKVFKTLLEAIHTQATRQPATKKIQEETQKKNTRKISNQQLNFTT